MLEEVTSNNVVAVMFFLKPFLFMYDIRRVWDDKITTSVFYSMLNKVIFYLSYMVTKKKK